MLRLQILERLVASDLITRFFKVNIFAKQTVDVIQYHSGGDDYNPPLKCEGLGNHMGNNPKNGIVFAWRDEVPRVAEPGEKKIYATNENGSEVLGELHLKNTGQILLKGFKKIDIITEDDLNITATNDISIKATNIKLEASDTINIQADSNFNLQTTNLKINTTDYQLTTTNMTTTATNITTSGNWTHTGNFTASHIEAVDGKTGIIATPIVKNGIVIGIG